MLEGKNILFLYRSAMEAFEELINFTSLGMLILDQVHLPGGKVVENVIGGSGSYGKYSVFDVCNIVHIRRRW